MQTQRARTFGSALVALALLAGACSNDDDTGGSAAPPPAGDTAATTTTAGDQGPTPPHYGGHQSEIYADAAHWLCRPELDDDACSGDLDTTIVQADGTTSVEPFAADPDAPVDCFYVYPTISSDPTPNSDLEAGNEEIQVVRNQTARLGEACRVFAPVYRQVTLGALMGAIGGTAPEGETAEPDRELAYTDVLDAFKHYIDNDSDGRGFVLIGHSQGSGVLNRLIAEEIDGDDELRGRLVAAYLLGSSVAVPEGEDVGGDFQNVAACRSETQVGCVVSYASFRAGDAPVTGALFGRPRGGDGVALCVNPAAPSGGSAELRSYFPKGAAVGFADPERNEEITTPFVAMPGLVSAECVERDGVNYLEVSVHGDPADPRADDFGGDFLPGWGLHLVDVNLAMGDIVALVRSQSAAFLEQS